MKWQTENPKQLGKVMESLDMQVRDAQNKMMVIWEEKLRLHVKPRPKFIPPPLWAKIVNLVITQSSQRNFLAGSQPQPEETINVDEKRQL